MAFVTCSYCAGQLLHFILRFIKFWTAVTADDVSNQATKVKMTVHIGFIELCTAVTADGKICNQATEVNWPFI